MNKVDCRKLSASELSELRNRAVASVQNGESPEVVARALMISRSALYSWLALYRSGGKSKLNAKKRGGRKPKVSGKVLQWIYETVTMNNPEQFKFPFALWTSKMLAALLKKHHGITLSKASICRLLNQLGLSAQRPVWKAWQQEEEKVNHWLEVDYPAIAKRAKREGGEIWFSDEAGVRSDSHSGTTWAPKGVTPIVKTTGARFGYNIISAVSRRGEIRFMCIKGKFNSERFIEFLERLINGSTKKVFLIVDGHPCHKSGVVKKYLETVKEKLELFILPPYSPELNPDEFVWNDLKNNALGRKTITGPEMLKKSIFSFLRSLQRLPDRVRSYFQAPTTKYTCI